MTTYVDFATNYGDIVIQMFDADAPLTVANFVHYASNPALGQGYTGSFFHRLATGFVLQGGGYDFANGTVGTIAAAAPVPNEFSAAHSNLAGTVAMAKLGGDPNSATDQFFFNLGDNSANLDAQNGGFTVFGQVTDATWDVVQRIAGLQTENAGSPFDSLPVQGTVANNTVAPSNLVTIQESTVTTTPPPSGAVAFTDTVTGISGTTAGDAYTGPVAGLQRQYIWGSTDGVAMAAAAPNMFVHGGAGDDALSVSGGSNVLDGGTGSNFLSGGTGADGGTDTFFVDGRSGGTTWSTLVNFHHGDALTIFGFTAASTLPWTAVDGVQGFQGATIHSELAGAGTGVNDSVTFAGISQADALSKFTITTGQVGDTPYLYVAYTG